MYIYFHFLLSLTKSAHERERSKRVFRIISVQATGIRSLVPRKITIRAEIGKIGSVDKLSILKVFAVPRWKK